MKIYYVARYIFDDIGEMNVGSSNTVIEFSPYTF